MSHWAPGSTISRFNRAGPGAWMPIERDFARVLDTALDLAAATRGAFDPTIGRLSDLWGFGPAGPMPIPRDAAIEDACGSAGWHRLAFDSDAGRIRQPGGLAIDLSGIAKGFAVDAVADTLSAMGIRHLLVEIGGELVGRGVRPDGEPWWVDLETSPDSAAPPLRVALHGIAVATSGDYVRGAHSIDPRTGRPPGNRVHSVSVIADSAMQADALATAATILFPDLSALGDDLIARVVTDDGEYLTPGLQAML